jgi:hypothetical protein
VGLFQIIRSIENLLYEIMTWLVFYPRTLWQTIRHPLRMSEYSELEQSDAPEEQYTDMLSPPLFLLLSILITHGLELGFGAAESPPKGAIGRILYGSEETLLLTRAVVFSIYPLTYAVALVARSNRPLDRTTLRAPFYSQCYVAGLFALLISAAGLLAKTARYEVQIAGGVLLAAALVWYITVQSMWLFDHLTIGRGKSISSAVLNFLKATLISLGVTAIVGQ